MEGERKRKNDLVIRSRGVWLWSASPDLHTTHLEDQVWPITFFL